MKDGLKERIRAIVTDPRSGDKYEVQGKLAPLIREHLDHSKEQDIDLDQAFDDWNDTLADIVINGSN